jgi:hypothetical protein
MTKRIKLSNWSLPVSRVVCERPGTSASCRAVGSLGPAQRSCRPLSTVTVVVSSLAVLRHQPATTIARGLFAPGHVHDHLHPIRQGFALQGHIHAVPQVFWQELVSVVQGTVQQVPTLAFLFPREQHHERFWHLHVANFESSRENASVAFRIALLNHHLGKS